jgi:hypothetical protein
MAMVSMTRKMMGRGFTSVSLWAQRVGGGHITAYRQNAAKP